MVVFHTPAPASAAASVLSGLSVPSRVSGVSGVLSRRVVDGPAILSWHELLKSFKRNPLELHKRLPMRFPAT